MIKGKTMIALAALAIAALTFCVASGDESEAATIEVSGNLNYAIAGAADGDTIVLTADITENVKIDGKTITIDLNGHKITNDSSSVNDHTVTVRSGSVVTFIDSSRDGSGVVDNVTHAKAALAVYSGATVTLNGGTFERSREAGTYSPNNANGNSWYTIRNHGTLIIDGASVINNGGYSSNINNGWHGSDPNTTAGNDLEPYTGVASVLEIRSGYISGGINAVKNSGSAELNMSGGTVANTSQASILNWSNAKISGGTIDCVINPILVGKLGDVASKTEITGGTFIAGGNHPIIQQFDGYSGGEAAVTGGTFNKEVDAQYIPEGYNVSTSGGEFKVSKPYNPLPVIDEDDEDESYAGTSQSTGSGDDTTTIVACAAAAVVAALMATFLILDRRP